MAVIVTGATSFIGRAVVEELLKQGQKVYAVAPVSYTHLTLPTKA